MTQPTLEGLPGPRRRRPAPAAVAEDLPVARVVVDRSGPHLDRLFDYAVPAASARDVRPGVRVRVRIAGQDADGFVVERTAATDHVGELLPLRRLVSPEVVLTPAVLALCRAVAARWAGTLSDVVRLAVPSRHARTEGEQWPSEVDDDGSPADDPPGDRGTPDAAPSAAPGQWQALAGGTAFLRRLSEGGTPQAVWSALPGGPGESWADAVAAAALATRAGGRGTLVVVPSAAAVAEVEAAMDRVGLTPWTPGARRGRVRLVADDGPADRYRSFLAAARGHADVVVGTRAAAFAPLTRPGLLVCWDEADALHAEPRAPYPHVRDVLGLRAELAGTALLVGGYARSAAAQRWVESGRARPLQAARDDLRARTPRVRALGRADLAAEGPAAAARLPAPVWRAVRAAVQRGPVLVQVPRAGYVPVVACAGCRGVARCGSCHGPLGIGGAAGVPSCRWCGRLASAWRCPTCRSDRLRSVRVGSERTAEELGRAFPGVTVRTSGAAGGILREVPDRPALVVATPGAEPRAAGGYAAAVLLDAAVTTGRDGLDVLEQALRTWLGAACLVRAAPDGGEVLLVGDAAPAAVQALVRWDPGGLASRELAERQELLLPPAVHVLLLEGPRHAIGQVLARAELPGSTRVLGPLPVGGDEHAGDVLLSLEQEESVRAILRSPWDAASVVTREVTAVLAARSARREPGVVRVRAEPAEV